MRTTGVASGDTNYPRYAVSKLIELGYLFITGH